LERKLGRTAEARPGFSERADHDRLLSKPSPMLVYQRRMSEEPSPAHARAGAIAVR